jgi:uncharacterized protein (TIGR03437 family)
MTNWRAIAILTLFYAPVAAAQTAVNWTQQNPQTSPPAREGHAMAYDSGHGQVVLFGGYGGSNYLNDTWVWDGSNWTQMFPQTSPPARAQHTMAYDSAHSQVVLFGGSSNVSFYDTWVWDGANWTEKSPQTSPTSYVYEAMAYAESQVVLFDYYGETWTWDGSNWTKRYPQPAPDGIYGFVMAYDSTHDQVVLFEGEDNIDSVFTDTWLWSGSTWTQESPQASPPAGAEAMVYDSAQGQAVVFGGVDGQGNTLNDTWGWDGSNWIQDSPTTSPSVRSGLAMAYDSAHSQVVLFGGYTGTGSSTVYLGDTWTYGISALPPAGPAISGVVSASAFGGFSSVAPGSWVEIYGSNLAPDTRGWTSSDFSNGNNAPTSLDGVSVSIGGQAAFVDYISPTQVNAELPSSISTGGTLPLTVTNGSATSAPVNLTVNAAEPGLLAPASFKIGGNQYVVAQLPDGTYVLPTGAIAGVNSRPAQPGEIIVIYGIGFGSVVPNIPVGQIATGTNQLAASFEILFGQTSAQSPYFGLAPGFVGLYQFNVTVPAVANNDLEPLTFNLGGAAGTQTLFTAVQ